MKPTHAVFYAGNIQKSIFDSKSIVFDGFLFEKDRPPPPATHPRAAGYGVVSDPLDKHSRACP